MTAKTSRENVLFIRLAKGQKPNFRTLDEFSMEAKKITVTLKTKGLRRLFTGLIFPLTEIY